MKRKRHTEEQIIAILKEHEAGMKTADLCRKHGISEASFYNWKAKYGGRSPDWLKMKNANAPAVKREAEQDGRGRGVNDLSARALIILATVISVVYWVGR
jgi:putative transposase